jgi:hypothetical protein
MPQANTGVMEVTPGTCEHRWRYFVHVESRAVRVRECERCHRRGVVPTQLSPLPRKGLPEKLTA